MLDTILNYPYIRIIGIVLIALIVVTVLALLIAWYISKINFNRLSYDPQDKKDQNKSKDIGQTDYKENVCKEHPDYDNNRKTVSVGFSTKVYQKNFTGIKTNSTDREKEERDGSTNNPAGFKISQKDIRVQQRKLHKEEARRKREAETLEKKKRAFNPLRSKPDFLTYTNLSVVDGELVKSTWGKVSYYRCWSYENRFFFEFFCEESRLSKSINNHSVLIDPFCQKSGDSKPYNEAKSISTIEYGELDSNLNIVSKPLIKYS